VIRIFKEIRLAFLLYAILDCGKNTYKFYEVISVLLSWPVCWPAASG